MINKRGEKISPFTFFIFFNDVSQCFLPSRRIFWRGGTLISKSIIGDHNQVFLLMMIRPSAPGWKMAEYTPYLETHSDNLLKQSDFIKED